MTGPDTTDSRPNSRYSLTHWFVVGGGFAGGLICGAVALWGQDDRASDAEVSTAVVATETSPNAEVPQPRAVQPEGTAQFEQKIATLRDQLQSQRLQQEMQTLRNELAAMKQQSPGVHSHAAPPQTQQSAVAPAGQRMPVARQQQGTATGSVGQITLAYWNRLNQFIDQESAMRGAPSGGVSATNAGNFLDSRINAGRFASDAIRAFDTNRVDRAVVLLANRVADWYDEGATVAEKGKSLLV
jgi:hypothetical protein